MRFTLAIVPAALLACATLSGQNITEQQFVEKAAQINMTEAHLGELAQQKSTSAEVKNYGQMLAREHKTAYQNLTAAASGFNVPKAINSERQQTIDRLQQLSGNQFEQQFHQTMVESHEKAIQLFERAANELKHQALRNYATAHLSHLRNHLQSARNLAPAAQAQAGETAESGERSRTVESQAGTAPEFNVIADQSLVHFGTVTRYEPGKEIELKVRNRLGKHVYDITEGMLVRELPAGVRVGSTLKVTEMVDKNGRRALLFAEDTSGTAASEQRSRTQ